MHLKLAYCHQRAPNELQVAGWPVKESLLFLPWNFHLHWYLSAAISPWDTNILSLPDTYVRSHTSLKTHMHTTWSVTTPHSGIHAQDFYSHVHSIVQCTRGWSVAWHSPSKREKLDDRPGFWWSTQCTEVVYVTVVLQTYECILNVLGEISQMPQLHNSFLEASSHSFLWYIYVHLTQLYVVRLEALVPGLKRQKGSYPCWSWWIWVFSREFSGEGLLTHISGTDDRHRRY